MRHAALLVVALVLSGCASKATAPSRGPETPDSYSTLLIENKHWDRMTVMLNTTNGTVLARLNMNEKACVRLESYAHDRPLVIRRLHEESVSTAALDLHTHKHWDLTIMPRLNLSPGTLQPRSGPCR